jgi:hypothetical protein
MKIVIENEVKKSNCLQIGDIVVYDWGKCIVIRGREAVGSDNYYSLMDLTDGGYANSSYASLEELTSTISDRDDIIHYSSDEYELILQKKKKC